jgi:oxygen-independent coproporphyrinogen-3 oxidase
LHGEIDMEPEWAPLDAINFGGGTPTAIGADAIAGLIEHLERRFGIATGAEISVEANAEDITDELVDGLLRAGVNRLTLGIQSLDDTTLGFLGRVHDAATALQKLAECLPHFSVGVDLIFGSPGESLDSWKRTVDMTLGQSPHHVSAYSLTVETGTALWKAVRAGAVAPDPDDQADKYEYMQEAAAAAHLVQYEVSNYARPGHTCRYNLATWGQGEYLGFGLGAHGHRAGVRRRNVRSITAYVAAVGHGGRPEAGRETTADPEMERLILGLRRNCGVDLGAFAEAAAADPGIQRLVAAEVVELDGGRIRVMQPLLADEVGATVLSLSP